VDSTTAVREACVEDECTVPQPDGDGDDATVPVPCPGEIGDWRRRPELADVWLYGLDLGLSRCVGGRR
jgi:hypothetical protein